MKKFILAIRSTIYFILFMITAIIFCVSAVFTSILPSVVTFTTARIWCRSIMFLLKVCCGIKYHVTGLENIPNGKTVIFASKHQSAWETFAYQIFLYPCVFMYKRELAFIPLFGIAMVKTKNIPVNRGHGSKEMIKSLRASFAKRLEKYNIAWLEDIQPWHLTKHYERIAKSCNVPIATGEDIYKLISEIKEKVKEKYNIELKVEQEYVE